MNFSNLQLIAEYPKMINGKYPFRLYSTDEENGKIRYHFGWPEFIIKPFLPLLETTLYWGEPHWTEQDGFYIYWLPIVSEQNNPNWKELNKLMKFQFRSFNECLQLTIKWSK